ncbi:hypothetical protein LX36DRAFT_372022 [Colletotrichum falcatum]|nr:hypothetical protein LX36DRAFT_372022 [Colletotrichum falcatum]
MLFPALQAARAACHRPGVLRRQDDLNGLVMTPLGNISRRGRGRHCHTGKLVGLDSQNTLTKPWTSRSSARARLELAWELRQRLGGTAGGSRTEGWWPGVAVGDVPDWPGEMQHRPDARVKSDGWSASRFLWHVDSIALTAVYEKPGRRDPATWTAKM